MEFMAINVITFIAREMVVRECQKERMSFKRDYAGVYGYTCYERKRDRIKGSDQRETRGAGKLANGRYWSQTVVIDVHFSFYLSAIFD